MVLNHSLICTVLTVASSFPHLISVLFIGSVDKGIVEVTNCFCVPHKEHADQVEAELNYAMDVYDLNRRVNSTENIVG